LEKRKASFFLGLNYLRKLNTVENNKVILNIKKIQYSTTIY